MIADARMTDTALVKRRRRRMAVTTTTRSDMLTRPVKKLTRPVKKLTMSVMKSMISFMMLAMVVVILLCRGSNDDGRGGECWVFICMVE